MRLICPNCGAQYEVPDDVIPAEGRDVQCSNCGDTWFQAHPDTLQSEDQATDPVQSTAEEPAQDDPVEEESPDTFDEIEPPSVSFEEEDDATDLGGEDWNLDDDLIDTPEDEEDIVGEDDWRDALEESDASSEAENDENSAPQGTIDFEDNEQEGPADEPPAAPQRRGLDPSIADVLREEAEHEQRARAEEERAALETQEELGLTAPASDASRRANEARDRMRKLRGLTDETVEAPAVPEQTEIRDSRRDLLPDIEETNSTLRHSADAPRTSDAAVEPPASDASRGRGFRLGFVLVILLAAAAVFVYSRHETLSASYPQFAPQIEGFVAGANDARVWLDTKVTGLFLWLNNVAGGGNG
ncbi:putative Zn finger-like uncharacterized protein [Shimia isoporae]|uniref:Putative Zn finger-like uncharacterized protein n=1 Tax=Shimia isoporae TaxID=647720 RepID=A0A4R1NLE9_9RHOB|nr:zinc-ribbon domain-containing protein [Shimia isoporae]TCL08521.1 putative Zn finger-like uncharacterized protein [Shimia isoporae]